ncbi:MAG: serine/threonine protein kinase [Chthonomonadaceae bacterium]|nr:serine/threonine protein kinase [Chthonomonadaceae bacterium]
MSQAQLGEGEVINGRYRVIRPLGKGGMGSVYLAEHTRLHTIHALKQVVFPAPDPTKTEQENEDIVTNSEREARTLVSLDHPNLPRVTDAFVENDCFYLVMEFIEGSTLETRLRENGGHPLSVRQVLNWGLQISDVLSYLHSLNPPLIFRDLKPANVMVQPDGKIRLIDFGIARRFQPGASRDTALLGSVGYSPPEQFGRAQTDIRSDVYAFGATLHHLLTGRDPIAQPFKFPPADTLNLLVSKELSQLVGECVAMDPDARPFTMHVVAIRLLQIKDALPTDSLSVMEQPLPLSLAENGTGNPSGAYNSAKLPSSTLRAPTQETPSMVSPEPERRDYRMGVVVAGFVIGLFLVGGTVYFNRSHKSVSKTEVTRLGSTSTTSPGTVPVVRGKTSPPDITTPEGQKPQTNPDNPAKTTPQYEATFEKVGFSNVVLNAQSVPYLRFMVSGNVKGQRNVRAVLSLFFYDASGNPLSALDGRTDNPYRNPDGQLSIAQELLIADDPYHFEAPLYLPVDQISPALLQNGVQLRAILLINNNKATESLFIPLPTTLPAAQPPSQTPDPTKTNAPPSGGGTISGAR